MTAPIGTKELKAIDHAVDQIEDATSHGWNSEAVRSLLHDLWHNAYRQGNRDIFAEGPGTVAQLFHRVYDRPPKASSGDLLELLQSWMNEHRKSILDGTSSCPVCGALMLEDRAQAHRYWHNTLIPGGTS